MRKYWSRLLRLQLQLQLQLGHWSQLEAPIGSLEWQVQSRRSIGFNGDSIHCYRQSNSTTTTTKSSCVYLCLCLCVLSLSLSLDSNLSTLFSALDYAHTNKLIRFSFGSMGRFIHLLLNSSMTQFESNAHELFSVANFATSLQFALNFCRSMNLLSGRKTKAA